MALSKILPASQEQFAGARNLIINGAMQVAQRGTSATGVPGYIAVDRFRTTIASAFDELALTHEQSTDAPTGFPNSYKITVSTPETTLNADELLRLEQRIEGQNLQHLKKGTSDAEAVTLSFWVKGSVTGTYTVNIFDQDNTRAIAKSYTINSANTWEYKTIAFAGDTTGALDSDNAHSLAVVWNLAAGTDRTSGTLATSWEANTAANLAVGQTDIVTTSGATWQITGVQLEVGEQATPFEHRSYADELARCQRYYGKYYLNKGSEYMTHGANISLSSNFSFPTTMRATPSSSHVQNINASNCNSSSTVFLNVDGCAYRVNMSVVSGTISRRDIYAFDAEL